MFSSMTVLCYYYCIVTTVWQIFFSFLFQNCFPELISSLKCATDTRDHVLVKKGIKILEIEKSPFCTITPIPVIKNISTRCIPNIRMQKMKMFSRKTILPLRSTQRRQCQYSIETPRDKPLTQNRNNTNS